MAGWTWSFPLPEDGTPLALRVERAIAAAIRGGQLRAGDRLPSTRGLAEGLGISRNTAVAAYRELRAQGWIVAQPGGRTRVRVDAHPVPDPARPRRTTVAAAPALRWDLGAGEPDLRQIPAEPLARGMRRALRRGGGALLGYRDPRGLPEFLDAIGGWLAATRAVPADRTRLMATRGAQHALDLAARTFVRPGDRVAVEALGYPPAWRVLELAGARLVVLPVDGEGARIDALESALRDGPIAAVYVTPHHQYPTTVSLSAGRRLRLLDLAREHGFPILEDDYDHEFHYEGRPHPPLASADPHESVLYVGTFSKVLAPGLRLGFARGRPDRIERMVELRRVTDRQGDSVLERAVADLVDEGELPRHVRRMREVYRARRGALADALREHLGGALAFDVPSGGIALWGRVAAGIDDEAWVGRAREHGLGLRIGRHFSATGERVPGLRLVFSRHDEGELRAAVRALAAALAG